jgi:hypothetical protein
VVFILVEGTYALAVDQKDLQLLPIMICLQGLAPDPKAFSAGIDGRPYPETFISLVDNDSIEQERLSSSVLSRD